MELRTDGGIRSMATAPLVPYPNTGRSADAGFNGVHLHRLYALVPAWGGVARFLFVPLAEAVVFAMQA
jgi:hypothetical protein